MLRAVATVLLIAAVLFTGSEHGAADAVRPVAQSGGNVTTTVSGVRLQRYSRRVTGTPIVINVASLYTPMWWEGGR